MILGLILMQQTPPSFTMSKEDTMGSYPLIDTIQILSLIPMEDMAASILPIVSTTLMELEILIRPMTCMLCRKIN